MIWSLIEVFTVITVVTVSNAVYVILIGGHCCAATEKGRCLHLCLYLTSTHPVFMTFSLLLTCAVTYCILYLIWLPWLPYRSCANSFLGYMTRSIIFMCWHGDSCCWHGNQCLGNIWFLFVFDRYPLQ